MQLEFELGEIDQGKSYLERLLRAMRLTRPGPNFAYRRPAIGILLTAQGLGVLLEPWRLTLYCWHTTSLWRCRLEDMPTPVDCV